MNFSTSQSIFKASKRVSTSLSTFASRLACGSVRTAGGEVART
ncbi:MAG: hypothetical protein ACLQNE_22210 [Thermoguttaceae bacterium]